MAMFGRAEQNELMLIAVVVAWNRRAATMECLASLSGIPVICVDNGSVDGTPAAIAQAHPDVEVIVNRSNLGFAAGSNIGIRRALERGADWVLLINNDAVAESGLLAALSRAATAGTRIAALACKVLMADKPNRIEYAGATFNTLLGYSGRQPGYGKHDDGRFDNPREVGRATGAAMAMSRSALDRVGLLDETLFAYVEDVEWCLRARRAGLTILFVPDARVRHRGGLSAGGRGSPTAVYYNTRNTLVVCDRYRPLPLPLRAIRWAIVLTTHLLQTRSAAGSEAVLAAWRDYRAGRLGARE